MWMRRFRQRIGNNVGMSGVPPSPSNTCTTSRDKLEQASLYVLLVRCPSTNGYTHKTCFYYHGKIFSKGIKGVLFEESYRNGQWTYRQTPVPDSWNYSEVAFALQIAKDTCFDVVRVALEAAAASHLLALSKEGITDTLLIDAFKCLERDRLSIGDIDTLSKNLQRYSANALGQQDKEGEMAVYVSPHCK
ncbi:hypothetical protein DFH11DRAFT_587889 [Phellopilus nigrolimitatus]|nr:hypothetical protein DFH11DRAFT_587889 [Phellopilus nigrolimitatus]